ncbi:MAG: PAS domain-containing protein [Desulfarculus sp.]|nr:PAS domain-containing protein [Desulfarculus sp.]
MPESICPTFIHDRGVILWASQKAAATLGYACLAGRHARSLVAERDHPLLERALQAPGGDSLRYSVRTAGGGCLEVESRGRTMAWKGRLVRLVVVSFLGEAKGCGEEGE